MGTIEGRPENPRFRVRFKAKDAAIKIGLNPRHIFYAEKVPVFDSTSRSQVGFLETHWDIYTKDGDGPWRCLKSLFWKV